MSCFSSSTITARASSPARGTVDNLKPVVLREHRLAESGSHFEFVDAFCRAESRLRERYTHRHAYHSCVFKTDSLLVEATHGSGANWSIEAREDIENHSLAVIVRKLDFFERLSDEVKGGALVPTAGILP